MFFSESHIHVVIRYLCYWHWVRNNKVIGYKIVLYSTMNKVSNKIKSCLGYLKALTSKNIAFPAANYIYIDGYIDYIHRLLWNKVHVIMFPFYNWIVSLQKGEDKPFFGSNGLACIMHILLSIRPVWQWCWTNSLKASLSGL